MPELIEHRNRDRAGNRRGMRCLEQSQGPRGLLTGLGNLDTGKLANGIGEAQSLHHADGATWLAMDRQPARAFGQKKGHGEEDEGRHRYDPKHPPPRSGMTNAPEIT
jgi:hypothetical protein